VPHVDIKYFPRNLSEEQKQALSDDIYAVLNKHLQTKESSLSVALTEVAPEAWKEQVWDPIIQPSLETLVKKPGYSM
jgi:4-oxalocrotonate tautomerase